MSNSEFKIPRPVNDHTRECTSTISSIMSLESDCSDSISTNVLVTAKKRKIGDTSTDDETDYFEGKSKTKKWS